MNDIGYSLPRERLDALNGWKSLRPAQAEDGLLPDKDLLHLVSALGQSPTGPIIEQPIPDTDSNGSLGGRSTPRGIAVSHVGDVYVADPSQPTILYTRASLPPEGPRESLTKPFVPLWSFTIPPEDSHPLKLKKPVDLCLVPVDAPPGSFADCLVIADAERRMLLWIDRRQIVTRHQLVISGNPVACASSPTGVIGLIVNITLKDDELSTQKISTESVAEAPSQSHPELIFIQRGKQISAPQSLSQGVHSIVALEDNRFLLIGQKELFIVAPTGRVRLIDRPPEVAVMSPAFFVKEDILHLPGSCVRMKSLPYSHISIDRQGKLSGTSLVLVTRPRRLPRPRSGRWISQCFDGEARGFAWDRISFDLSIPAQCRLLVSTYVSDIAYDVKQIEDHQNWSTPILLESNSSPEFLIQQNKGRYLWVRIDAYGDGAHSPSISGIDIFGPRDSQLALLPAPFHQDPVSTDFLDRFLSLQDAFLREAMSAFNQMNTILNTHSTPEEFLDWLGSWFDWRFLSSWSIETRRKMIAQSIEFYAERGTIAGLERLLRWHTGLADSLPRVIEEYRLDKAINAGDSAFLGGESVSLEDQGAHRFYVLLPSSAVPDTQSIQSIERLINAQKPAHTLFRVMVISPGLVPGRQARLGLDAILPDSRPASLGVGRLNEDLITVAAC